MKLITIEEVEQHRSAGDCWTIIENKVYDITEFIPNHPGGKLILAGAGCDSTVMFNHYHFFPQTKQRAVLSKMYVGDVTEKKSPVMGKFYETLSKRVDAKLKDIPKHPLHAKVLFFVDYFMLLGLVWYGLHLLFQDDPHVLKMVITSWLAHVFSTRIAGQSHAVLHMEVFGPKFTYIAQYMLTAIGSKSVVAYHLPDERAVSRTKMNLSSLEARSEYPQGRGPYEHQALHHVRGAALEHDRCLMLASQNGLNHVCPLKPFKPIHHLQRYAIGRFLLSSVFFISLDFGPLITAIMLMAAFSFKFRLWGDVVCGIIGTAFNFAYALVSIVLPCYGGVWIILLSLVLRYAFSFSTLFYAQHKWDLLISEEKADTDWGKYNAMTTVSFHGDKSWWHPYLWLCGGCPPSTLAYHLEHTMFPGVCYLYYPLIAPVCETTCKEFDIPYHRIDTYSELSAVHTNHLINSKEAVDLSTAYKKDL